MGEINNDHIAETAANIENNFNKHFGYEMGSGDAETGSNVTINGQKFEVVSKYSFSRSWNDYYNKGVVLRDPKTNQIYIHFNGTGDGNWGYNAVAYGVEPQPSDMQMGCLRWFDQTMEQLKRDGLINGETSVYVTGHSQGGNNAMFVSMRSQYADNITRCIPLDGPDFSNKFVDDTKNMLGIEEYNKRCDKIYSYTGVNDYVDFLGQQSIVPENHNRFVSYTGEGFDFNKYHCANGMIDKNGKMHFSETDSQFRQLLGKLVEQIPKMPQKDQEVIAKTIMDILENKNNNGEFRISEISPEDFKKTLKLLVPVLAEMLKEYPDDIGKLLQEMLGCDPEIIDLILGIIKEYNSFPKEDREAFLEALVDLVKIENNEITIDVEKISKSYDIISDIIEKDIINNPEKLKEYLEKIGIKEGPMQYAAMFFVSIGWKYLDGKIEDALKIFDIAIAIYKGAKEWLEDKAEKIVKLFEVAKETFRKIRDYFDKNLREAQNYAAENPYILVDTAKLRGYAGRCADVNRRLLLLDAALDLLYLRADNPFELFKGVYINLLVSRSFALDRVKNYLEDTAKAFEKADNNANDIMGG